MALVPASACSKGRKWLKRRYFQRSNHNHWIFTGTLRTRKGKQQPIELMRTSQVRIRRYVKIRGAANPYDPAWELYLEERLHWQMNQTLTGQSRLDALWQGQQGRCTVCGQLLHKEEEEEPWHLHHRIWRSRGGQDTWDNLELLHANCHRQIHARRRD